MNLAYLLPRLARHFIPDDLARVLLRRGLLIQPGLETRQPREAADRYLQALQPAGIALTGKRVMVFGYGGNFALGCLLLRLGATHVVLCDKFAAPDDGRNAALLPEFADYLALQRGRVVPSTPALSLLHGDIRQVQMEEVDIVLSSSVYEHLDDVEGITRSLARLTAPGGVHLHYIDLRDHYFKYPFEMLTFSEHIWRKWLNPSSNLNRWRLPDYQRVFDAHFEQLEIRILADDLPALEKTRQRIRPEFLCGDPQVDAATLIRVLAKNPRHG